MVDEQQYRTWKSQLTPLLYDWLACHLLRWPTQAVRWGSKLSDLGHKTRHRVYLSEQTSLSVHSKSPPTLLACDLDISQARVATADTVLTWASLKKCPFLTVQKTIIHPGDVNKIRELPQHPGILVTHTDAPELYVWNVDKQPQERKPGVAECVLIGHEDEAQFPLAASSEAPAIASGGTDKRVLLWRLDDIMDGVLAGRRGTSNNKTTRLKYRYKFEGHTETVEDVTFEPGSANCLVSVGDDKQVLFWDARSSSSAVTSVAAAHGARHDVHCVDWSDLEPQLLITGAADGSIKVWDRRKLGTGGRSQAGAVHALHGHTRGIMRVEWHPQQKGILASGGEDKLVLVWNLARAAAHATPGGGSSKPEAMGGGGGRGGGKAHPPELLFKHVGHRHGVVDFQWCPNDPWTLVSVSDDTTNSRSGGGCGGTLQVWRMHDLIYRSEEAVVNELLQHRDAILGSRDAALVEQPKEEGAGGAAGMEVDVLEPPCDAAGEPAAAAGAAHAVKAEREGGVGAAGGSGAVEDPKAAGVAGTPGAEHKGAVDAVDGGGAMDGLEGPGCGEGGTGVAGLGPGGASSNTGVEPAAAGSQPAGS